jgi:hypothetical protein
MATTANLSPDNQDLSPLMREEYVEQAHFFETLLLRLRDNMPAQEVLASIREELLATTKMPLVVDFLLAELRHQGAFAEGMHQLAHYFTPFQCYVMREAENDRKRFDMQVALEILGCEVGYRSEGISRQGLFFYQLEAISRNRLDYDQGLEAISRDPSYDPLWREWILTVRRQIGIVELADLIYVRSKFYHQQHTTHRPLSEESDKKPRPPRQTADSVSVAEPENHPTGHSSRSAKSSHRSKGVLFGLQEGRIAWANRHKDLQLLFSALHRQLGYPHVPRPKPPDPEQHLLPALARRVEQLEARLKLVEQEQRGGIDLERFFISPPEQEQAKK